MDHDLKADELSPGNRLVLKESLPLCLGVIEKAFSVFLDGRHVGTLSLLHKGLWRIDSMFEGQHVVGLGKDEVECMAVWWRNWSSLSLRPMWPEGADDECE